MRKYYVNKDNRVIAEYLDGAPVVADADIRIVHCSGQLKVGDHVLGGARSDVAESINDMTQLQKGAALGIFIEIIDTAHEATFALQKEHEPQRKEITEALTSSIIRKCEKLKKLTNA